MDSVSAASGNRLMQAKRLVVKIGSSLLVDETSGADSPRMAGNTGGRCRRAA